MVKDILAKVSEMPPKRSHYSRLLSEVFQTIQMFLSYNCMAVSIVYIVELVKKFVFTLVQNVKTIYHRAVVSISLSNSAEFQHIFNQRSTSIPPEITTNIPLLYPLKPSENLRFSDVSSGYRNETLVGNGLVKAVALV